MGAGAWVVGVRVVGVGGVGWGVVVVVFLGAQDERFLKQTAGVSRSNRGRFLPLGRSHRGQLICLSLSLSHANIHSGSYIYDCLSLSCL